MEEIQGTSYYNSQSYDDQQHRFNHQYEVDQVGDIRIRDQLLKVTNDSLQQDQGSSKLGDMIPARMEKLTILKEEEATTDFQTCFCWRYK